MSESNKIEDEPADDEHNLEREEDEDIEEWNEPSASNDTGNENEDISMKNEDGEDDGNDNEDVSMKNEDGEDEGDEEDDEEEENNSTSNNEGGDGDNKQEDNTDESSNKAENMDAEEGGSSDQPSDPSLSKYYLVSKSDMKTFIKYIRSKDGDDKSLRCHFCKYKPKIPENLDKHYVSKHPKIYCCKECDYCSTMRFKITKHTMVKHQRMEDRPYPCPHCSHRCVAESILKEHIKNVHERKKNFPCPKCHLGFASKVNLKAHYRSKHATKKPSYLCPYCEYKGDQMSELRQHVLDEHKTEKPHLCPFCDFVASQSPPLKKHMTSEHPDEMPYACNHCDFRTVYHSSLASHLTSKHPEQRVLPTYTPREFPPPVPPVSHHYSELSAQLRAETSREGIAEFIRKASFLHSLKEASLGKPHLPPPPDLRSIEQLRQAQASRVFPEALQRAYFSQPPAPPQPPPSQAYLQETEPKVPLQEEDTYESTLGIHFLVA